MPRKLTQEEFNLRVKNYTQDTVEVISPYVNRRTHIKIKCKCCGYEWEVSPISFIESEHKNYSFQGCPQCKYTILKCAYCGKEFKRLKSAIKSDIVYCSKECGNRHKNNLIKMNNSTAYRRNAFDYYPHKCAICGWNEDERILEVHHIDENHDNNELNNLMILCPICHKKLTLHLYKLENNNLQPL